MIVVDTNVIASLFLQGENSTLYENLLKKDPHWIAPLLWRSEMGNILSLYLRKQKLNLEVALRIMEATLALMRRREFHVPSLQVLKLCAHSSCSAYDCEFVQLATDQQVPLVTFDQEILKTFPTISIHPQSF